MTILDLLNIDLKTFKESDFKIGYSGENSQGDEYIDYEKFMFPKILNIFDNIQLKMFSDNFRLTKETDFNLILFSERNEPSLNQIKDLINLIHNHFGKDDEGNTRWTTTDTLNYKNGVFDRFWDLKIDENSPETYTVHISFAPKNEISVYSDKSYFSILILSANKLLDKKFNPIEIPESMIKATANKKNEGCFIATACYGDYNSPEVLLFRKYRDETLAHSYLGRLFIKFYYKASPFWARQIEKSKILKSFALNILLKPTKRIIEKKYETLTKCKCNAGGRGISAFPHCSTTANPSLTDDGFKNNV